MRFAWPLALLFLLVVPALGGLYLWWLRRKRKFAVQYSSLSLIRQAMPARATWRRHLPVALLLVSLASMAVAMARPQVVRDVAGNRTSVVLALDVSRSMCAVDIEPNRLAVAQDAARSFVLDQAGQVQIGIVAFAGTARVSVPPTDDVDTLIAAIDSFRTAFGTAIGRAQLKSLDVIAEINPNVEPSGSDLAAEPGALTGDFESDIVVLLTDGANSGSVDPIEAAQTMASRRIRVYTIGFGTNEPAEMICGGTQIGADAFGNGEFGSDGFGGDSFGGVTGSFGGGGGRGGGGTVTGAQQQLLVIDEPTLQSIADITGGEYFRAADAAQLVDVFLNLPTQVQVQQEEVEVSVWFSAAAFAFLLVALAFSLRFNRS